MQVVGAVVAGAGGGDVGFEGVFHGLLGVLADDEVVHSPAGQVSRGFQVDAGVAAAFVGYRPFVGGFGGFGDGGGRHNDSFVNGAGDEVVAGAAHLVVFVGGAPDELHRHGGVVAGVGQLRGGGFDLCPGFRCRERASNEKDVNVRIGAVVAARAGAEEDGDLGLLAPVQGERQLEGAGVAGGGGHRRGFLGLVSVSATGAAHCPPGAGAGRG